MFRNLPSTHFLTKSLKTSLNQSHHPHSPPSTMLTSAKFLLLLLVPMTSAFTSSPLAIFPRIPNNPSATILSLKQDNIADCVRLVNSMQTTDYLSAEKKNKIKVHAIKNIESLQARIQAEAQLQKLSRNKNIMTDLWEKLKVSVVDQDDVDLSEDIV